MPATAFRRRSLIALAWPLFLVGFLSLATTLVDTILLSAHSEELNAAVSVGNQVLGVFYDLSTLFSIGALVLVAQHLGAGRIDRAREAGSVAIAANAAAGIVIAVVIAAAAPLLVGWVNTPAEIVGDTILYVIVSAVGLAFNAFLVAATAVLRGFGRTIEILVLGVLANVLYLALEYVLIFGAFGIPALGVAGAAIATVLVRGVGIVLIAIVLKRRAGVGVLRIPSWRVVRREVRSLTKLSTPTVAENVVYDLAQLALVAVVAGLGVAAVLSRSYALTLGAFISILVLAVAQANETVIGYDRGAGDVAIARRRALRTAAVTAGIAAGLALVIALAADVLLGLFSASDEIVASTRTLLFIGVAIAAVEAVSIVIFGSLRSVGDVVVPVVIGLGTTLAIGLPLGFLLAASLGVPGVFVGVLIAETVKAAALTVRWARGRWGRFQVVEEAPPQVLEAELVGARR